MNEFNNMTKGKLIKILKEFPDDIKIKLGIHGDSGTYNIYQIKEKIYPDVKDNYLIISPGSQYHDFISITK